MIYVDESIQQSLGYICVGFAYCDKSPEEALTAAIVRAGLRPGQDEYKSGARMQGSPALQELRDEVYGLVVQRCRIGLYVAPVSERPTLLTQVAETADLIVARNGLSAPQEVYVDEGIAGPTAPSRFSEVIAGCDSRVVAGIQLADFVAFHCSYLLKAELTGASKKIQMGDAPHPLAGEEVDLDWILRTELRRNFFVRHGEYDETCGDDLFFQLAGFGAFFSPRLPSNIMAAAEKTFDTMYFGCVW